MDNTLTTTSTLSLFNTDKEARKRFVNDVITRVLDGQEEAIKVLSTVKCMEDIIKQITASVKFKEACINEAEKYGKSHERYNAKFEIKEAGTKYNYKGCGDVTLLDLYEQLEQLSAQIKKREEFLKLVPSNGIEIIDPDTGEVNQVYPPSKSSTTTVFCTLK